MTLDAATLHVLIMGVKIGFPCGLVLGGALAGFIMWYAFVRETE